MRLALLAELNAARRARRSVLVITDLGSGHQRLVYANELHAGALGEDALDVSLKAAIETRLQLGQSGALDHDGHSLFIEVHRPPTRLIVVGAGHIAQALVPLARLTGFDVLIIDPRTAFATPERFPDVRIVSEWPQVALQEQMLDTHTAMAVLSHDPRIDDPALIEALRGGCFYIGALGSRKTHDKRRDRLRAEGFDEADLARIHAPIGLDIGAVSPVEIAISIMAEIIASLKQKPARQPEAKGAVVEAAV